MLTLSAKLPMVYMSPATFQGSQTASHWHYQVHCSAWSLRKYSHCLCLRLKIAQTCGTPKAAIQDSHEKQALQCQGLNTHRPGKAEVWTQEKSEPTEDEQAA